MVRMQSRHQPIHYRPANALRHRKGLVIDHLSRIHMRQGKAEIKLINALSQHLSNCCWICTS